MVWMDSLRGAAIIAVVVMHAELEATTATGVTLPAVHLVDALLGPVRMPLLVLLSGMLLPVSLAKGPWSHVRRKLAGIGWPYVVWGLLDVVQVQHARTSTACRRTGPTCASWSTTRTPTCGSWPTCSSSTLR